MLDEAGLDALVDVLLEVRPAIEALQAPTVDAAYRVMLFALGREIARRQRAALDDDR